MGRDKAKAMGEEFEREKGKLVAEHRAALQKLQGEAEALLLGRNVRHGDGNLATQG